MNVNRFQLLCTMIQFDDSCFRKDCFTHDYFAAVHNFSETFNKNCAQMRLPVAYLAIDKTLYPYRGRVKLKQYNYYKPAK